MFATTNSCALLGTDAIPVRVEAQVETGLPRFTIVGMSESDERATRERVRCGLIAIGADLPLKRVTVSVAPADLPKGGAGFDVPIMLAVLGAMGEVPPERIVTLGAQAELGLDGQLRTVSGSMSGALVAARQDWHAFVTAPAGPALDGTVTVVDLDEPLLVPLQALWQPHTSSAVRDLILRGRP